MIWDLNYLKFAVPLLLPLHFLRPWEGHSHTLRGGQVSGVAGVGGTDEEGRHTGCPTRHDRIMAHQSKRPSETRFCCSSTTSCCVFGAPLCSGLGWRGWGSALHSWSTTSTTVMGDNREIQHHSHFTGGRKRNCSLNNPLFFMAPSYR